jgi:hypothetical protein
MSFIEVRQIQLLHDQSEEENLQHKLPHNKDDEHNLEHKKRTQA